MSAERLDNVQALINLATGQGVGTYDPANSGQIVANGQSYLDQNTQSYYRRSHKILRKLIETIPNQMTFRWGMLTLGGEDGDTKIKDGFESWAKEVSTRTVFNRYTGLAAAFNAAQIAANETGNAALIILADDGQEINQPLVPAKIRDIKGFYLADRWAIKPDMQGLNIGSLEGGITHYVLTAQRAVGQLQLVASNGKPLSMGNAKIHRSRVLWFRGEELSDYSLQLNSGCDDSVLEGVVQAFREYNAGLRGAGRMLVDFDFFVHQIEGYFDKMMGDGSKEYSTKMMERLQANSLMRSSYRGMAIDKDKEVIDTVSRSVAGYSDLLEQVLNNFLSNTDLQPSELLQQYPKGLANTGKTEQQNCNDRTRLYQSKKFDSNLRDLLKIVFAWKGGPTKGVEPKVWDWEWNELYPTTPLEQSELELNWAQIDAQRIQSRVYSPDDAAKSHYSTPEFNPHITIDFKERERLKKEQEKLALEAAQQGQDPSATQQQDPLAGLTFDAADPLVAPQQVRDAAKKGLQIRRQIDSQGIPARVALLGRKLDAGQHLSNGDVQAIQFYHQRHRPPVKLDANAETALYLLHGGPVGKLWADRALMPPKMDAIHPAAAIGVGLVGATALGVGVAAATNSKKKGKPCGEGYISSEYECQKGGDPPLAELSDQENEAVESLFSTQQLTEETIDRIKTKAERIKAAGEGITDKEAMGLGAYIDDFSFAMNAAYSNPAGFLLDDDIEYKNQVNAVNRGAINALKKLPRITEERIAEDGGRNFGGILIHHATINREADLNRIKARFARNSADLPIGRFLSTTYDPFGKEPFRTNANLEVRVKPLLDGKGAGVLVDSFKNEIKEDEVLFHPEAKFKVKDAYQKGRKYIISLEEV